MDVNETMVGLWLEQQGYFVRYRVPYAPGVGTKDVDLVALHPTHGRVLAVEVKGWHTEKVTPGYVKAWPKLFDFAGDPAARAIADLVGDRPVEYVLVVGSASPAFVELAAAHHGVRVVDFREVLHDLIDATDLARHATDGVAHTLRVLQRYGLLTRPSG